MHIRISLLTLLLVAPVADAGLLYKCSSAKGAVTIQSDPCPTGSTEIWQRDSTPAPQPTLQQVVANSTQGKPQRAVEPTPRPQGATPPAPTMAAPPIAGSVPPTAAASAPVAASPTAPPPPAPANFPPRASTPSTIALQWHDEPETPTGQPPPVNECDSAKAFASSVQEKIWLGLTQDQTQRLYNWVLNQCDGR